MVGVPRRLIHPVVFGDVFLQRSQRAQRLAPHLCVRLESLVLTRARFVCERRRAESGDELSRDEDARVQRIQRRTHACNGYNGERTRATHTTESWSFKNGFGHAWGMLG